MYLTERDIARFWNKVDRRWPDECWEWMAYRDSDGYGVFDQGGRPYGAYWISLILHTGRCYEELMACHTCRSRSCVNPAHLYWGTAADNVRDAMEQGTQRFLCGEDSPQARLTGEDVFSIRDAYASGKVSQSVLAERYGVSQTEISNIVRNVHWKDDLYAPRQDSFRRFGEKNSRSKLTWEVVREIRRLHESKACRISDLARIYGLTESGIQKIIYRRSWVE